MKCKKIVTIIAFSITFLTILISTIWDFSVQLQLALTRETYKTLSDVSTDYNKAFLDRISYNIKTMKVISGNLEEMHNITQKDMIRILNNAVNNGEFSKIVVCDKNGTAISNTGITADVSECDYFKSAMNGKTDINHLFSSTINEKDNIVISVPIYSQETPVGALLGVYPLSTESDELLDFTYYSEGYGFVISPNGDIILSSNHADKLADGKNLFKFFEKTDFIDFSLSELKSTIKKGEKGSFSFIYNGNRRFVSFTPTSINDWYTFSLSSDAALMQQKKTTNMIVIRLIFRTIIMGLFLFVWVTMESRRHNKELAIANQKYQSLLSHINGGMVVAIHATTADETIITYVSSGFTDMTGYTLEDIQNIYNGRYLDVIIPEDRSIAFATYLEQLKLSNTYFMPYRIRKKDGSILWVMDNGYLVDDVDGLRNHSILTDITVIKQQEEELRMSENRFSIAINASSGTLFEVDLKRKLYTHFENAERIFGVSSERLLDETRVFSVLPYDEFVDSITHYFFNPDDYAVVEKAMKILVKEKKVSYEARLRRFDNSYIWSRIDLSLSLDEFDMPSRLVGFMSDIDDIKKQSEILKNKLQTDPMTGLYNKIAMATLANKILNENPHGRHALIVLDIDNFKGINDTLGHVFGDLVIIEITTKLKASFRNNDIVGRMGGDEFAILMKNISDTSSVLKKATELSAVFRQTYAGEKENYKISCSIGIIMIENNTDSFEVLYRKADAALYHAKRKGKDQFVLYQDKDAKDYPIEFTRTNDEELQNLKTSRNIEAQIFELLYSSKDFNVSINMALAAIGQQYHVSRVAIFENDDDDLTISNIYEWCNDGIDPAIDSMQNLKLTFGTESILDCFDENGLLYCSDVRELPPYIRQILESKNVLSALKIIISNDEKACAFIGFDECTEHRVWTSDEIEKLSFLSKVLSVFLFKKKTEVTLLENLHTRLKILDVLPDYICVVNPETHSLVYANLNMQELFPLAHTGAFCFTTLRGGQSEPCETCLIERIKAGDTSNLEIISEDKKVHLKVNAISIKWTNDKKMVLLYGIKK